MITVAQADGVTKQPTAAKAKVEETPEPPAPKVQRSEDPDDDVIEAPVKRQAKKTAEPTPKAKANLADVVSAWSQDE